MDGTPILDIKPYLPYADCRPEAAGGFASAPAGETLAVECLPEIWEKVPPERREALRAVLALDPGPGTRTTRSGSTASASPGWRCAFPWRGTFSGFGKSWRERDYKSAGRKKRAALWAVRFPVGAGSSLWGPVPRPDQFLDMGGYRETGRRGGHIGPPLQDSGPGEISLDFGTPLVYT